MFGGITFAGALFGGVVGIVGPLPAVPTNPGIIIGGIEVTARVRVQGVTIRDVLNDAPNTANLTIEGAAPTVGQSVTITIGSRLIFAGALQTIDQAYESLPTHLAWHLTAIDDTGRANMRRPFGTFVDTSATTIAQTITTTFAPGFATTGIAAGLPNVTITFDGADTFIACLARLATAVGGYCKIEDRRVYLFLTDPADPPDPIDANHRFLINPPITLNTDTSQLRTRVYGKGYGENVPTDVGANETLIPIRDGALFPVLGGTAIVGFTADGAQSDRIAFTGVSRPVGGTLVGTGAAPTTPPGLAMTAGSGVETGTHSYAYGFVTAGGRSLPSASAAIGVGAVAAPGTAPHLDDSVFWTGGGLVVGDAYTYKWTFRRATDGAQSGVSAASVTSQIGVGTNAMVFHTSGLPVPPAGFALVLYRSDNSAAFKECTSTEYASPAGIASLIDKTAAAALGPVAPAASTTGNRVTVTYPAGPSAVTNIEIYRTAAGASQLKLLQSVGSNTAGTITDSTPDASLGANAPATDTSGLTQPQGQVNPGSSTLIVASPAPFAASGGWVTTGGGQVVRYTGISGQLLTGVPASGPGAITTTILYGQQAVPTPTLTGVTGLTKLMAKGSTVAIWIQRDDTLAQSEHAARTGTDGVVEFLIVDARRGVPSLTARCDADLKLFSRPILTVQYATRDMKTASGKTVSINLSSPPIVATMVIQEVTITEIGIAPNLAPRYTVKASTVRFSLEDTLRRLIAGGLTSVND